MQEFHFPNWVNKFTLVLLGSLLLIGGYLATCLYAAHLPTTVNVGHRPIQPVPFGRSGQVLVAEVAHLPRTPQHL